MASATQPTAAQVAATNAANNMAAQNAILKSCPREVLKIGTFGSFTEGATMRQKLTNVGLLRSVLLHVVVNYNVTAAATPSLISPFNILSNIKIKDYQGTDIVNCSGIQLFCLQSVKYGKRFGMSNAVNQTLPYTVPIYTSNNILSGTVANNKTADFFIRVPLAYMPEVSLKGSLLMQSVTGEAFIEATFNNSFFGTDNDSVFSAGAGSLNSINVTVYQDYLSLVNSVLPFFSPQGKSGQIPFTDMFWVYELNGSLVTTSDLSAGQEKLINYPNFRNVLSMLVQFDQGGAYTAGNVTQIRLIENANQYVQTWSEKALAQHIREGLGCDLPPAFYYMSTRNWPIDTVLYGNYQLGFTPSAVAASSSLAILTESFYMRGASLTGLSQGA